VRSIKKVKQSLLTLLKSLNNTVSKNVPAPNLKPPPASLPRGLQADRVESKSNTEIAFQPFKPLRSEGDHLDDKIAHIQSLIASGKHQEAIVASEELMSLALAGLRYLQTYDWLFLRSLVTAGFLGWTLFVLVHILDSYVLSTRLDARRGQIVSSALQFRC
jgi:Phosphatidylinositolglycan class N (PIG-N)